MLSPSSYLPLHLSVSLQTAFLSASIVAWLLSLATWLFSLMTAVLLHNKPTYIRHSFICLRALVRYSGVILSNVRACVYTSARTSPCVCVCAFRVGSKKRSWRVNVLSAGRPHRLRPEINESETLPSRDRNLSYCSGFCLYFQINVGTGGVSFSCQQENTVM